MLPRQAFAAVRACSASLTCARQSRNRRGKKAEHDTLNFSLNREALEEFAPELFPGKVDMISGEARDKVLVALYNDAPGPQEKTSIWPDIDLTRKKPAPPAHTPPPPARPAPKPQASVNRFAEAFHKLKKSATLEQAAAKGRMSTAAGASAAVAAAAKIPDPPSLEASPKPAAEQPASPSPTPSRPAVPPPTPSAAPATPAAAAPSQQAPSRAEPPSGMAQAWMQSQAEMQDKIKALEARVKLLSTRPAPSAAVPLPTALHYEVMREEAEPMKIAVEEVDDREIVGSINRVDLAGIVGRPSTKLWQTGVVTEFTLTTTFSRAEVRGSGLVTERETHKIFVHGKTLANFIMGRIRQGFHVHIQGRLSCYPRWSEEEGRMIPAYAVNVHPEAGGMVTILRGSVQNRDAEFNSIEFAHQTVARQAAAQKANAAPAAEAEPSKEEGSQEATAATA